MRIYLAVLALLIIVSPSKSTGSLLLSELMINPVSGGEWIELAAAGNVLSGCQVSLSDASGRSGSFTLERPVLSGYLILAVQDSTTISILSLPDSVQVYQPDHWPTLNNDGDSLHLSIDGRIIELMIYNSQMVPPTGRSLERIDFQKPANSSMNWGECSEWRGNTAGLVNSLRAAVSESNIQFWADPNPFEPVEGDGRTYFHFTIPSASARATLDIFTVDGRPLIRLISDLPIGTDSPSIPWDGRGKNGLCPLGRYVAVLRTFDQNGHSYTARCSVVLVR